MPGTATAALPRWVHPAALVAGVLVVIAAHFRPWEVGFLEEWPLSVIWTDQGPLAFAATFLQWSLSRPLHLVPTALGFALGGGSPAGIFAVLALVAAGQFLLVVWAFRPLARAPWVGFAIALFVALHPLWPGGYLQRFLPAQTAMLAFVVALGFLIRWLLGGRIRSLVAVAVALLLGLCVYPGPAVAAPFAALVLALAVPASRGRRIAAVLVVTGCSALMTVYSFAITRLIVPSGATYEAGNAVEGYIAGPLQIVRTVVGSLIDQGAVVVVGILGIAVLGAVLALTGAIPNAAGWLMTGAAVVSPVCTIVFFGNVMWLQDIERVAYATSLGLVVALVVWRITATERRPRLQLVVALLLIVASVIGGVRGIQKWQPYIGLQHQLMALLAPAVAEADGDEIVIVVDHTGTFGTEYTLPQVYISAASHVLNGDDTEVWLCYEEGDPAVSGSELCDPRDTGDDPRLVTTWRLPAGDVEIYLGRRSDD